MDKANNPRFVNIGTEVEPIYIPHQALETIKTSGINNVLSNTNYIWTQ
ncbi:MAG: hypothetical protein UY08_C0011G0010 [Candidatus Gottesmanbacteria bacterium GW2011_GWA1_47_8]|uniref:Uncharacterized protein n=1 Tax=Candidatus Gottesmanbacteria bacterium GW2011_GWA1_47_8 TaxID=1618438 RepID=A0A0G1VRD0_9BACT|nr:MAG: hypothetical protein UY08_C0011G0010 [Candidatus Gottesmanbacteria bacterium GW2011_GWA1_47_8]